MKKILITGLNSYIGDSFASWLEQWPDDYEVTKWDFKDETWKDKSFSEFDSILNVAAIVHKSTSEINEGLYYSVNRDLAINIANKAKVEGVRQFIQLSTMAIYGNQAEEITLKTDYSPDSPYGKSKLQAELGLEKLRDDSFKVAIVRPPMIYGKNSIGNYTFLSKFAQKSPIFPDVKNQRSMLHIDNLNELIRLIIDNESQGVYFPQMEDYVTTSEMVKSIAKAHKKTIILSPLFNPMLKLLKNNNVIKKVFGNLYYKKEISNHFNGTYLIINLEDSIRKTELN